MDQKGSKWVNRCIFCYYCNALIDPLSLQHPADEETDLYDAESEFNSSRRREPYVSDEYFHQTLLPHLLLLTEDNISNVKICAARTIRNILVSRPFYQDKQSEGNIFLFLIINGTSWYENRPVMVRRSLIEKFFSICLTGNYNEKAER